MRKVDVAERRARLARQHCLAPGHRAVDVVGAAKTTVCLHGTNPASVYLSARARIGVMTVVDMERALHVSEKDGRPHHVSAILRKLGVSNRAAAAKKAVQLRRKDREPKAAR